MKTLQHLFVVVLAVFLVACGGGGSLVDPTTSAPTAPQADVTFVNVQGDISKTALIPGQRDVEAAAFRMSWANSDSRGGISQLVFTNQSSANPWAIFKDFKLVDDDGKDVNLEAPYSIRSGETGNEVVVDFYQYQWTPNDWGVVPKTYSLLVSLKPGVANGTTFAFKLSAVQMHSAWMTAVSEVVGRNFSVAKIAGVELPIITSTSPSSIVDSGSADMVQVGSFDATCPAENSWGCQLSGMTFYASYMSQPLLVANSFVLQSSGNPGANVFTISGIAYYLAPGQTVTFAIFASVYGSAYGIPNPNPWIEITDMAWVVGSQQVKVNPAVPTGQALCGSILGHWTDCKG